jgi:hypothetical protein
MARLGCPVNPDPRKGEPDDERAECHTRGLEIFLRNRGNQTEWNPEGAWMADLKKAGERVECLWSKSNDLRQSRRAEKS